MTDEEKSLLPHIGDALRAARLAAGLTQEQVATSLGADAPYVLSVEKGRVNVSATRLVQFAAVLGATGAEVLDVAIAQWAGRPQT